MLFFVCFLGALVALRSEVCMLQAEKSTTKRDANEKYEQR